MVMMVLTWLSDQRQGLSYKAKPFFFYYCEPLFTKEIFPHIPTLLIRGYLKWAPQAEPYIYPRRRICPIFPQIVTRGRVGSDPFIISTKRIVARERSSGRCLYASSQPFEQEMSHKQLTRNSRWASHAHDLFAIILLLLFSIFFSCHLLVEREDGVISYGSFSQSPPNPLPKMPISLEEHPLPLHSPSCPSYPLLSL